MVQMQVEVLRAALVYSPETGVFTWASDRGSKTKAGSKAGSVSHFGYIDIRLNGKLYKAHRLAWLYAHGEWPEAQIDHINGDRADNRLANLRPATNAQNACNRSHTRASKSGRKGVSWHAGAGKWAATIHVAGKATYLGLYELADDASRAYAVAAAVHHREFARA